MVAIELLELEYDLVYTANLSPSFLRGHECPRVGGIICISHPVFLPL